MTSFMTPQWQVELIGERLDLEELPEWLADANLRVEVRDGSYFMSGSEFDRLNEAGHIHSFAIEIVNRLNALGRILWPEYQPVQVGAVVSEGGHQHFVLAVAAGRARVKGKAVVLKVDGTVVPPEQPFSVSHLLEVASSDALVDRVLMYLRTPEVTWADLYRSLEAVEEETGDVSNMGWFSQRDLFRHTANSFGALGIDARHGHAKHSPPKHPMTIEQAKSMVFGVIAKWLQTK